MREFDVVVDVNAGDWNADYWKRLVKRIRQGRCTPFLGAGACVPTLPTGAALSEEWAKRYRYPFDDKKVLPEVMQFATVLERDPMSVKEDVDEKLKGHGEPDFTSATLPHALLAKYPFKVFLTTNYDDFMTRALEREGKHPVTAVCPWYRGAEIDPLMTLDPGYEPTEDRPLVYHLHGCTRAGPASFVLPSQDNVEFLVTLASDVARDERRMVPVQILPALTRQPLLFVGYRLQDPDFRMLYHGFVDTVPEVMKRRHMSVQLAPDLQHGRRADARAKSYLTKYFATLNIAVYWGTADEFCAELRDRMAATP